MFLLGSGRFPTSKNRRAGTRKVNNGTKHGRCVMLRCCESAVSTQTSSCVVCPSVSGGADVTLPVSSWRSRPVCTSSLICTKLVVTSSFTSDKSSSKTTSTRSSETHVKMFSQTHFATALCDRGILGRFRSRFQTQASC